jgi:hypothetical protein
MIATSDTEPSALLRSVPPNFAISNRQNLPTLTSKFAIS